ncbi:MAG: 4-hydroxythreonine-4-phosphate dehydrogenase PdxA [Bacteroidales bacterium]|nr:4-hydroxythreonine-4-phosphate dehydrogenase PdxA [Bacteroidales bacterium]MCL2133297.1 4-hydroxythreonine-4-phosphate dehydrogenase PdxA [Bacteroidales bacterium]
MNGQKIRVGITHGDINGIGYEIILKTFADNRILDCCTPIIYGSSRIASYYRKLLPAIENFSMNNINAATEAHPKRINMLNCITEEIRVEPSKPTVEAGMAALRSLEAAVTDLKAGKIDVLVTSPFNKHCIQSDKFNFPGHTEYLAAAFNAKDPLMLLIGNELKVGIATGHAPLSKVSGYLTSENILTKLQLLNDALIADFNIRRPRIAVLGLNPHAGDNGLLGKEEEEIISPAITEANKKNILAFGPYPADGFFGTASYLRFDAVLAMYHDQGLVPFKTLAFNEGVNYTAGMPYIRTSPAHGVGYDIVGSDKASPDSFRAAIYAACDIFNNRKAFKQLTANPLKTVDTDKL